MQSAHTLVFKLLWGNSEVFAVEGWHIALMEVKFDAEESIKGYKHK